MTLEQMFRIVFLLSLGFAFNKLKLIPRTAEAVLSRFVTMLFLPSLTLYSNMMECKLDSLAAYSQWVLYGGALCVISILMSFPIARLFSRKDEYQRGIYRYALSIPNTGAVGTPLVLAFFGTSGMFQYGLFQFVCSILTYSWGIMQLQPSHGRSTFWSNVKKCFNLNFLAMLLGMALGLLGAKNWMPTIVANTVHELGNCYVIVALLLTGFSIADYPFSQVFGDIRVYGFSLLRLIVFPLLFLAALLLIKAPAMVCIMAVLSYASPCGMNVVVYPSSYGEDCKAGASMVLVSSLGSVCTVPLIYALTQSLL